MATISGTATKLSDSTAAVGAKITLINSDTNAVIATTTTAVTTGAYSFAGVADGINVHVVGEWEDGGIKYNCKSQPFLSTGLFPSTLANLDAWILASESALVTTRGTDPFYVTAVASKDPATADAITSATESQHPQYINNIIRFLKANSTHIYFAAPYGTYFNRIANAYTISVGVPVWGDIDNTTLLTNSVNGSRLNFGQGGGGPSIKANNVTIADYPSRPTWVVATWRVDNGNGTGTADIWLNDAVSAINVPSIVNTDNNASEPLYIGSRTSVEVSATMDLAELVIVKRFVDLTELEDLHNYMLAKYQPA